MNVPEIARLYNSSKFTVLRENDSGHGETDKRYTYLLSFDDGQSIALKVCKNLFTTPERIDGWQKLCRHYLDLGIYCPQIINSVNGNSAEIIIHANEEFIVYAEEMKKYKTMDEQESSLELSELRPDIIRSVGRVAACNSVLLPWPSVYCLYDCFDDGDQTDENYDNAKAFCAKIKESCPQYADRADAIWNLFLQKRDEFESIYRLLPKASFQSDLNPSNILINERSEFAGLIDFNLSGTACILYYILLPEVCGYRLQRTDIEQLNDDSFLKKCDDFLFENLTIFSDHYKFTDLERAYFCLCYNTAMPFCYYMINDKLLFAIAENRADLIPAILDWVHYQLSRDDLSLPIFK